MAGVRDQISTLSGKPAVAEETAPFPRADPKVVDFPARAPKAPVPSQAQQPRPRPRAQRSRALENGSSELGQILVENRALSPGNLAKAAALRIREDARFDDILLAQNMVTPEALYAALAHQYDTQVIDLSMAPPDVRLVDALGADFCVQHGLLPWKRLGAATVVVSSRPDEFAAIEALLSERFGRVRLAIAPDTEIHSALMIARHRALALRAETRVTEDESCRTWQAGNGWRWGLLLLTLAVITFAFAPLLGFGLLVGWAVLTLAVNSGLKLAAAIMHLRHRSRVDTPHPVAARSGYLRLPSVSILVPLLQEREIAGRLLTRLVALNYPRELLDICLIVEEDDTLTQQTLAHTGLPRWMRQIIVPRGALRTKPRALNFALDFCRGSIIGVYDAEDAPEPDQIHKVVRRFAERGPSVACLQGVLDFYNTDTNWLSRAFAIEYATWFRIVLPGLERMGFAVPLGGTTLFFRRAALEELGGWDAHNVTEDADLGVRLARHGYHTELIETVTKEEANCRPLPWVRQRSRWIKGYAMTWAVHMRHPQQLLDDIGWWKLIGVQILFLGTLSQFLLAPLLWSFWALPLGLPHPLAAVIPAWMFWGLSAVFAFSEILTLSVGALGVSGPEHRFLIKWVPTLHFYWPLASIAALKAMIEIITKPFYWDKTAHGRYHRDPEIWQIRRAPRSP